MTAPPGAVARAAWLRLTPEGLARLPAAMSPLPPTTLPSMRHGDLVLCEDDTCTIRVRPATLAAKTESDDVVALTAGLRVEAHGVPVRYAQRWPCAFRDEPRCQVSLDTAEDGATTATVATRLRVAFTDDGLLVPSLGPLDLVHGLDAGDLTFAGANRCGQVWCGLANLRVVRNLVGDRIDDALRNLVPPAAMAAHGGVTVRDGDRAITFAAAIADEVDLGPSQWDAALRLDATPRRHRCVPRSRIPDFAPTPRRALDGEPAAHARLAIGERTLARLLWATAHSGLGCRAFPLDGIPGGASLLFPSLRRLGAWSVENASVTVAPVSAPTVTVEDDGTLQLAGVVALALEADVDARRLVLASAHVEARVRARLANGAQGIVLTFEAPSLTLGEVRSTPLLGASHDTVAYGFRAIADLAAAAATGVSLPAPASVPAALRLARAPRRGPGPSWVLDLSFGAP